MEPTEGRDTGDRGGDVCCQITWGIPEILAGRMAHCYFGELQLLVAVFREAGDYLEAWAISFNSRPPST